MAEPLRYRGTFRTDSGRRAFPSAKAEAVREKLNGLPSAERRALTLREFDGMHYTDIARVMEIGERDVKMLLFRARMRLRDG